MKTNTEKIPEILTSVFDIGGGGGGKSYKYYVSLRFFPLLPPITLIGIRGYDRSKTNDIITPSTGGKKHKLGTKKYRVTLIRLRVQTLFN